MKKHIKIFLLVIFVTMLVACKLKSDEHEIGKYKKNEIIEKAILEIGKLEDLRNLNIDTTRTSVGKFNRKDLNLNKSSWIVDPNHELVGRIDYIVTVGKSNVEHETDENYFLLFYNSESDQFILYSIFNSHTHEIPFTVIKESAH